MYVGIRKYRLSASDMDELERRVREGFLPLIREADGFLDYYFIRTARDTLLTISAFEEQAQVEASTRMAADWVKQNVLPMLPNPPEVTMGEVALAAHSPEVRREFTRGGEAPPAPIH